MSKMPALSRSFQSVSLNVLSNSVFCGAGVEALKSGSAMRIFSTPRPVPVLIQSCAEALIQAQRTKVSRRKAIAANRFIRGMKCIVLRQDVFLKEQLCIV